MNKNPSEFVIFENDLEQKVTEKRQTNVKAVMDILNQEYDGWQHRREYVRQNMWKLRGLRVPLVIESLQDIENPYNCVILNDIVMMPYDEIYDEIKAAEGKEEQVLENQKLDKNECPVCSGMVTVKPNAFSCGNSMFDGLQCLDCNKIYDYNKDFRRYEDLHNKLRRRDHG